MFNANAVPSLSDIAAVTGNNNNDFGGGNGWWILIILFAIFGGWGRGYGDSNYGGNGGAYDNYVLASDFSMIERKLDSLNNGVCSLGYDQLAQMNGINTNINASQNAIMAQLNTMAAQEQACCCQTQNLITTNFADLNYNLATQGCNTRQAIADATATIVNNDNCNYRALNDRLTAMEMSAKDEKIADLQAQVNAMHLASSQQIQSDYIVNQLRPAPVPSFIVPNPFATYGYNFGCTTCSGVNA